MGALLVAFIDSPGAHDDEALVTSYDAGDVEGPRPRRLGRRLHRSEDKAAFEEAAATIMTAAAPPRLDGPEDD